jgi:hypothetical protein
LQSASKEVIRPSLWLKRWAVVWSAGFTVGVTIFFGRFAYRAWRITGLSHAERIEQAEAMLRFVGDQLRNHNGVEQIEKHLPEAGFVAYMVYGQALVNVALANPSDIPRRRQLAEEVQWCLEKLAEPEVTDTFPDTQVPHGLLFLSQRTLLLAGLHLISDTVPYELTEEYHDNCRFMAEAFEESPYGLPDSFPGFCWPADTLAALRCLRLHDEMFGTEYSSTGEKWKSWASGLLASASSVIPLRVDSQTGEPVATGRGSSQAVCLIALRDVDEELFRQQYQRLRSRFGNSFLGLRTWREFPEGEEPRNDIDTGPVIHGHGVLATLTGMIAAKLAGDDEGLCGTMALIEAVGQPSTDNGMRQYLNGRALPLDLLVAYALSATPWTKVAGKIPQLATSPSRPWLFAAVFLSIPLLTIFTATLRYRKTLRKVRPLSLWHSASPSSEGIILFWTQLFLLVSLFFSSLWFPVLWAAFGAIGRAVCVAFRVAAGRRSI